MTPGAALADFSIDVVVPAYDEAAHIGRCLDAVCRQDYPRDLVRILVVDAGSADETVAIARGRAAANPLIKVLTGNGRLTTPEALNLGIGHGSADLVARVDGHGWPEQGFLRRAAAVFQKEGPAVACVGGRAVPEPDTPFGRALAIAWTSRFGVGASVYAAADGRRDVDTVPWGMYRREALEDVGAFDPSMNHGEDEELNWRLRRAGHRVVLDTSIRFRYINRGSWAGAFRQYRDYGEARMRVVSRHHDFLRPHHAAPALLVSTGAALAFAAPFNRRARRLLAILAATYGAAVTGGAVEACDRRDGALTGRVATAFTALHLGYGVGTLRGLITLLRR